MTFSDISNFRLKSQQISETQFSKPSDIVKWMGAMQAQDYQMAKYAIGIRLPGSTDKSIEESVNNGEIIRTHLMRPTWHFVSAEDIYWMLELTTPQIKSAMNSSNRSLELTKDILNFCLNVIEKVLSREKNLTRDELNNELKIVNIKTNDNRLSHILMYAELVELICSGNMKDNKLTYSLLSDRVPVKIAKSKDEALSEFAKRYFSSHCPATLKDFIWWSGLRVKDARQALENVKSKFISETIGDETYWLTDSISKTHLEKNQLYLIPAYDEFLISYQDRSASLSLVDNKKAVSNNGIFRPVIVIDGQVKGLWKKVTKKDKIIIEIDLFEKQSRKALNLIDKKIMDLEIYLNKKIELILSNF